MDARGFVRVWDALVVLAPASIAAGDEVAQRGSVVFSVIPRMRKYSVNIIVCV